MREIPCLERKLVGGTVAVRSCGAGPALALLHSLIAGRSSFDPVVPGLAESFRVLSASLPGFDGSAGMDNEAGDLTAIADRMAEAVREAAPGEPVLLLGNGYGGFIALLLAARHPHLVSRLVLADCGAAFSEPGREAFRAMARLAETQGLEAVADHAMHRLFAADFHAANPAMVADRRARFLRMDRGVFVAACRALAGLDLRAHATAVAAPALVVVGEQDEATPVEMARELADLLPAAELVVLPGCAHVPQLQAADQFLAVVLPFLRAALPRAEAPSASAE